jgi:hypothetical protein
VVDIFDEVEEELRAERAKNLLVRYGGVIVAACVIVVAITAGWQGWRWWQARQDMAAAAKYVAAMAQGEGAAMNATARAAAIAQFDPLATTAPEGYRTLARLREAALKADAGDLTGAAGLWDQVAGDSAADPLLRDLASLLWAARQLDSLDPALLEARLKPLTTPDNAWRASASEQLALLDLRQNRPDAAKATLRRLAQDVTAPAGVRGRSSAVLGQLGG